MYKLEYGMAGNIHLEKIFVFFRPFALMGEIFIPQINFMPCVNDYVEPMVAIFTTEVKISLQG